MFRRTAPRVPLLGDGGQRQVRVASADRAPQDDAHPQVAERLALMLRSGVPLATAAAAVNVPRATLHRWLARPEPEYVSFREQVEQARAEGEAALVLRIARESATRWQSAAWLLERIAPAQYGPPGDRPAGDGELSDLFAEFAVVSHDDAPE